jgi:hypothetical protein
MQDTPTTSEAAAGSIQQAGSAKYVDCKCIQCGWLDGFKQDVITQGLVGGWCETCGRETVFRASEPPIDPR